MTSGNLRGSRLTRGMFGGDVMPGCIVKEAILRYGPDYPLGLVVKLIRSADLAIVVLECVVSSSTDTWTSARKAF